MITEILANLTLMNFFILSMGAYSLTRLIVTDSLFEKARQWIFHRFPHEGFASEIKPLRGDIRRTSNNIYVADEGHLIGELLACPWCTGFWVSLFVFLSFVFFADVTVVVLIPFAMRAFVGGFANKIGGG